MYVLLLLLPACGGLRIHGAIASAAAPLIDAAGAAIEQEQAADLALERAKNDPATLSSRVSALKKQFDPVVGAYEGLNGLFEAYVHALVAAVARGDKQLGEQYLRGILESWLKLEDLGSAIGVTVPAPPKMLQDEAHAQ